MLSHRGDAPDRPAAPRTGAEAPTWRTWHSAWLEAAYGDDGFWSREQPGDHFATAVGAGPLVAQAVAALAPPGVDVVVDVGAGDAALLVRLLDVLPGVVLVGVDRRGRPPGLDPRVAWVVDHHEVGLGVDLGRWRAGGPARWCGDARAPLLVAHEWLDDLPVPVVERGSTSWHQVEVDDSGRERPGPVVAPADAAWLDRWWDDAAPGDRAEVGRARDEAWAGLVAGARAGRALAVDYGHVRGARPPGGSVTAYADGRQRRPVPDGRVNLTAGVAVDALAAAGRIAGATTSAWGRQADVLPGLVGPGGAGDPVAALERRTALAALTSPGRWGGLWWLAQGAATSGERPLP